MDDYLVNSQTEKNNKTLFCKFNVLHEKNSYTREVENNNEFPFLDKLVQRKKQISLSVYIESLLYRVIFLFFL